MKQILSSCGVDKYRLGHDLSCFSFVLNPLKIWPFLTILSRLDIKQFQNIWVLVLQ